MQDSGAGQAQEMDNSMTMVVQWLQVLYLNSRQLSVVCSVLLAVKDALLVDWMAPTFIPWCGGGRRRWKDQEEEEEE